MLGCRGGGKLSRAVYLAPNLSIDSYTFYDHFNSFKKSEYEVASNGQAVQGGRFTCFKLFEYEDASITVILH